MRKSIVVLGFGMAAILVAGQAIANKVVVIPLGGGTGNAEVEDVLIDKTFSNSTADGLIGKRPPAPVPKTGQKGADRLGDDGHLERGVEWPVPRFFSSPIIGFGVLDKLTGLSWQKSPPATVRTWVSAIDYCYTLDTGFLTYRIDDWRLPNIKELLSLIDYGSNSPALPLGHPFILTTQYYWSSTSNAGSTDQAVIMVISTGTTYGGTKTSNTTRAAWCVRGGLN